MPRTNVDALPVTPLSTAAAAAAPFAEALAAAAAPPYAIPAQTGRLDLPELPPARAPQRPRSRGANSAPNARTRAR